MSKTGTSGPQHTYEIRKDGKVYVRSSVPNCGYPPETLRRMKAAGYRLYIDGKLKR